MPLSPDFPGETERDKYEKYLSKPLQFPQELKTWLTDWLAVNVPFIPVSQVMGYKSTLAKSAVVTAQEDESTEHSWEDFTSTFGPEITELSDGVYFVIWGYFAREIGTQSTIKVGVSINGADPTKEITSAHLDQGYFSWKAESFDVRGGNDNNSVRLMYFLDNVSATSRFENRWIVVMRIT